MSVTEEDLLQVLRDWSTNQLYVGDQSEYRANTQLSLVSSKICFNSFFISGKLYALPSTDGYFLYSFPTQLLRGYPVNTVSKSWVNGIDYLNKKQARLFIYDNYGKLIPLGQIYIKKIDTRCYIAINKNAFLKTMTAGISNLTEVYLTFWVNPHPENPVTVKEYAPVANNRTQKWSTDNASALSDIYAITDTDNTFTSVLVNGVFTPASNITLGDSDYINIIKETDIFCKFEVTIDDNLTGYESTLYNDYREILHTPKGFNPKNYLLPHDLIDVIIKDSDTGKGLYQSRYDYRSVRQITHQDYSIDRTDADSLRDALHASTIKALVIIRNPNSSKTLKGDKNYIKDLYKNEDSDILLLLRGSYVSGLDFWKASNLEASKYISLMFTNTIKGAPSDTGTYPVMTDFLDALGYYNLLTVLDNGISVGIWDKSTLVALAPSILKDRTILPYVYINGRKLLSSEVISRPLGCSKVELSLIDSALTEGDKITVLLKDFTSNDVDSFTISSDNTIYKPKNKDYTVYSYDQDKITTITRSTSTYREDTVDGDIELTFYSELYGETVYIHYENNAVTRAVNIDDLLAKRESLILDLVDTENHPVMSFNSLDVFVNGYWCIKDIDYFVYTDTVTGKYKLAISNRNYLDINNTGNIVEWFCYGDVSISDDFDYIVDNQLKHSDLPYLFEPNVSEVYSEGLYLTDLTDNETYIGTVGQVQASVGEHSLRFPYILYNALPFDYLTDDRDRRIAICNFFKRTMPVRPDQVFLNQQHQVYSPWLNYIIVGLINGDIKAVNDPDPVRFITQFSDLQGLRDHDPCLIRKNRMDRDYLSIAAAYSLEMPDTTNDVRTIIQKLINLTLVRSLSSLGVTPV